MVRQRLSHTVKHRARKFERRYKRWKAVHAQSVCLQSHAHMPTAQIRRPETQRLLTCTVSRSNHRRARENLRRAVDAILYRDRPTDVKSTPGERRTILPISSSRKLLRYAQPLTVHRHRYSQIYDCTYSLHVFKTTSSSWL